MKLNLIYHCIKKQYLTPTHRWTDSPLEAMALTQETYEAAEGIRNYLNFAMKEETDAITLLSVYEWVNYAVYGSNAPTGELTNALAEELKKRHPEEFAQLRQNYPHLFDQADIYAPLTWLDDDDEYWATKEARGIRELLIQTLNAMAPADIYFGTSPDNDDNKMYGYWVNA